MIPISSLKKTRREGKTEFTYEENGEVKMEEIPISFRKPTEALWDELTAMEKQAGDGEDSQKGLYVRQLAHVEIQSTAITEDDGRPHNITEEDLAALDLVQLAQLWNGVRKHFFLQMPVSTSETTTNSTSEQAAAA